MSCYSCLKLRALHNRVCHSVICRVFLYVAVFWSALLAIIQLKVHHDRTSFLMWTKNWQNTSLHHIKTVNDLIPPHIKYDNPHPFSFTISQSDTCSVANYNASRKLLLIVVPSIAGYYRRRQAVRETWGNREHLRKHNAILVFLFGRTENTKDRDILLNETESYHDIIQEDFVDSYQNLSVKSVAMLKWVERYCAAADYVLKADDDVFINVANLAHTLQTAEIKNKSRFIMGAMSNGYVPIRNPRSKWYVPKGSYYSQDKYPIKWCTGSAYVISGDVIGDLFNASLTIQYLYLEDIFITGFCVARVRDMVHINNAGFHPSYIGYSWCKYREQISGHYVKPDAMRKIWAEESNSSLDCKY